MTTKVEELREEAFSYYSDPYDYEPAGKALDSLIAAAKAEEREGIRKAAQVTEYDADGYAILFAVPAFNLKPKEVSP